MSYIVEVRHIGADLAVAMAQMRMWLDDRGTTPAEFGHSSGGPGISYRLVFHAKSDAVAFAEAFRGTLNDGCQPQWVLPVDKQPSVL